MQQPTLTDGALTRRRLLSNPNLSLQGPLENFSPNPIKPIFRDISIPKMALSESDIQTMVEKRVPIFYGHPDVEQSEVQYFVDACKRIQQNKEFRNADQAQILLEEILMRLRGKAYKIMKESKVKSMNEFFTIITKNFFPTYSVESLNNRLQSARQNQSEDCAEFGKRVQNYALDYEAGIRTKYGEDNSLPKPLLDSMEQESFIRGLKNTTIQSHLILATDKTMKELVDMAAKLERQLGYTLSTRAETDRTNVQEAKQIKCQLCEEYGHNAKECSVNKHQNSKVTQVPKLFCNYCKRAGHSLANCRTKQASQDRQNELFAQRHKFQNSQMYTNVNNQSHTPQLNQRNPNHVNFQNSNRQIGNYQNRREWQPVRPISRYQGRPDNSQRPLNYPQNIYRPPQNQPNQRYGNTDVNSLSNNLNKLSINYIQDESCEIAQPQGNDIGLVEQRHQD